VYLWVVAQGVLAGGAVEAPQVGGAGDRFRCCRVAVHRSGGDEPR
jgi:hypothetical protein